MRFPLAFIPEEAFIVLLVGAAICIMIGFRRVGFGLFAAIILLSIFKPFMKSLMQELPLIVIIPILIVFGFIILRTVVGNEAMGHFVGQLMYDVLIKGPVKLFSAILRRR